MRWKKVGLKTANEVFADQTYQEDGSLTPCIRKDVLVSYEQKSHYVSDRNRERAEAVTTSGIEIPIKADTTCIHGDGEHSVEFANNIAKALHEHVVKIKAFYSCGVRQ